MANSTNTMLTYTTTSAAYSFPVGGDAVRQTWLDGSGKVINYPTTTPRGRYLASLVARKGFGKSVK